jgi:hypothetical protein
MHIFSILTQYAKKRRLSKAGAALQASSDG